MQAPVWSGSDADDAHVFGLGLLGWMLETLDENRRDQAPGALLWLTGWESATCAVVAGLISRAHRASAQRTPGQLATVLDALDVAAGYKRARAATCPGREASPAELCGTCEWRLTRADEYDALRTRLPGRPAVSALRPALAGQDVRGPAAGPVRRAGPVCRARRARRHGLPGLAQVRPGRQSGRRTLTYR